LFSEDEAHDAVESNDGQFRVCLSKVAVSGKDSSMSMRLMGNVQVHEVLMLVDSGNSHSFIDSKVAQLLSGSAKLSHPLSVKVANGDDMYCDSQFRDITHPQI
jgi:hypothetical protein